MGSVAHGEPNFIAGGRAIDSLQDQIESEAELQLTDDDRRWLIAIERHQVAAAHLALNLELQRLRDIRTGCCTERPLRGDRPALLAQLSDATRFF
jgi:hypothetical protein